MNPAQLLIRDLDRALAEVGQDVKLRKGNTADGEKTVRAVVRGFKPEELVGGITQSDKQVTISPTGLDADDLPAARQYVVVEGRPRSIAGEPEMIRVDGVLVRINMMVTG
jgi:hypothetical protein